MALSKSLFGTARLVPETDEENWGGEVTGQLGDVLDGGDEFWQKSGANVVAQRKKTTLTPIASATITWTKTRHKVSGSAGAVTLDTTTPISAGAFDGQPLRLIGDDNTNTVTILHSGNASLNGNVTLANGQFIDLEWDDDDSLWYETARSN